MRAGAEQPARGACLTACSIRRLHPARSNGTGTGNSNGSGSNESNETNSGSQEERRCAALACLPACLPCRRLPYSRAQLLLAAPAAPPERLPRLPLQPADPPSPTPPCCHPLRSTKTPPDTDALREAQGSNPTNGNGSNGNGVNGNGSNGNGSNGGGGSGGAGSNGQDSNKQGSNGNGSNGNGTTCNGNGSSGNGTGEQRPARRWRCWCLPWLHAAAALCTVRCALQLRLHLPAHAPRCCLRHSCLPRPPALPPHAGHTSVRQEQPGGPPPHNAGKPARATSHQPPAARGEAVKDKAPGSPGGACWACWACWRCWGCWAGAMAL
jgi:hypothetical protein